MKGLPKISVAGDGVGLAWVTYCGTRETVSPKSSVTGLWNLSVRGTKTGLPKSSVTGIFPVKNSVVDLVVGMAVDLICNATKTEVVGALFCTFAHCLSYLK